jgi:hypothetical protein
MLVNPKSETSLLAKKNFVSNQLSYEFKLKLACKFYLEVSGRRPPTKYALGHLQWHIHNPFNRDCLNMNVIDIKRYYERLYWLVHDNTVSSAMFYISQSIFWLLAHH